MKTLLNSINIDLRELDSKLEGINKGINYYTLALIHEDDILKLVVDSQFFEQELPIEDIIEYPFIDLMFKRFDFEKLNQAIAYADVPREVFIKEIESDYNRLREKLK